MASAGTETMGRRFFPRLHWSAIAAGVLLALAIHIVMGLIGAALGFAAAPADSEGVGIGAAVWGLLTPFVASLLGAWLAIRVAGEDDRAGANVHGILVWCIGLIAGALFLTGTLATGAMSSATAASGNLGSAQRMARGTTGQERVSAREAEAREDEAGKAGAAATGAGALAAIAGLLGAVAGSGLATRRNDRRGGWRIAIQRRDERHEREHGGARPGTGTATATGSGYGSTTGTSYGSPGESRESHVVSPSGEPPGAPPTDPFHH